MSRLPDVIRGGSCPCSNSLHPRCRIDESVGIVQWLHIEVNVRDSARAHGHAGSERVFIQFEERLPSGAGSNPEPGASVKLDEALAALLWRGRRPSEHDAVPVGAFVRINAQGHVEEP